MKILCTKKNVSSATHESEYDGTRSLGKWKLSTVPHLYMTKFYLYEPVKDEYKAGKFLDDPELTDILKDNIDSGLVKTDCPSDAIAFVFFQLTDPDGGLIYLGTTEALDKESLDAISDWVRGQASDGIGESFEQQDFAEYIDYSMEDEWGDIPDEAYSMASFDWDKNHYIFEKIR